MEKQRVSEGLIVFAVMALETFAIFASGGYFPDSMTVCILAAWSISLVLVLTKREEVISGWRRRQISLLGLAFAFWFWVGLSMTWSIAKDQTWIDFNRTGGYLALFFIGIMAGKHIMMRRLSIVLFLAATTAAGIYGLGPKTLPAVVDNLSDLGRIAVPIGYINAMGLLMALGYLLSIYISAARDYHWILRLLSSMAAILLLTCMFFTLSRGAALALLIGLIIYFILVPLRIRSFGTITLSLIPTVIIAIWSSGKDSLLLDRSDMAERMLAASTLRWYLFLAILASGLAFATCLFLGRKFKIPPRLIKPIGAFLLISVILGSLSGATAFVLSKPSFSEWSSQTLHNFKYGAPEIAGSARLLEMGSSGRWRLWDESVKNWQENPLTGSGAQSFPITHFQKKVDDKLFVKQPHGHPFQLLSELGIIGFALGMAFIATAMAFSVLLLCRLNDRWERSLAGALIAMLVVYLVHAAYDWDWNMFALTTIYFYFTGLLIGWPYPETGISASTESPANTNQ